jgi:hypothetical protein
MFPPPSSTFSVQRSMFRVPQEIPPSNLLAIAAIPPLNHAAQGTKTDSMRHLLIIPMAWLAIALSARATSVEIPITPTNLDQQDYTFAVSANTTNNETAFHITVTAKKQDIDSDSQVDLSIFNRTEKNGGITISGAPLTPAIPITLKKESRVWTADFTVSAKTLKTPNLYFIFSELGHSTVHGKRIAMPSVIFYQMKLTDFVKK